MEDLRVNGYTSNFIGHTYRKATEMEKQLQNESNVKGYTSIPYVKGVSERVKCILTKNSIKTV
jgi:hypothetical protein